MGPNKNLCPAVNIAYKYPLRAKGMLIFPHCTAGFGILIIAVIILPFFFSGPPDPPKNCTMTNQTQDSLQVDCVHGFSSGLKQEFHMEVFSHPEHHLLVNITARSPRLLARGLPPDSSLFLRLYASNVKGRSRSVTFDGYTLRMAEKQTGKPVYSLYAYLSIKKDRFSQSECKFHM